MATQADAIKAYKAYMRAAVPGRTFSAVKPTALAPANTRATYRVNSGVVAYVMKNDPDRVVFERTGRGGAMEYLGPVSVYILPSPPSNIPR